MFEAPRQIQSATVGTGNIAIGSASPSGIGLQRILSVIWRDKTTILWTTAFALLMALLFVVVVPHRYTAVTQILIDPTDLRATNTDLAPPNQGSDATVLQVESQVRVLTSDSVLRRVIKAELLDHDSEFVGQWLGNNADSSLAALIALKRSIQVKRAERTYVVDVSVTTREPAKAARIANAIADAYLAEQTNVRSDAARQISQSLSSRLNELKERVRDAEDRVEQFKERNNILDASGQLVNEQQLSEMNRQLGIARARTAAAKARLDQVQQAQSSKDQIGAFLEAVQSQTITALRGQYAEIMRREAEQMTSLGARHPAVIEIQAEADRLRHMIDDEIDRIAVSARGEYEGARANEQTLAENLEKLKGSAIATNEAKVTLRELERDVQANRAVYEAFLVRARETGEQERLDTKNIRVISRADLPLHRSFPPSNLLLAMAAIVLGVASGTGIIIMREIYEIEAPGARVAGTLRRKLFSAMKAFWPVAAPASSSISVLATLPDFDLSFGLEAAKDQNSPLAAALRKVHEAIRAHHTGRGSTSILIASDDEDDSVAVALSLAAVAAVKQRVLLIDADLDRPAMAAIDADENQAGLVDVALGRRELSEAVVHDQDSNIHLMPFVSPSSRRERAITEADIRQAFDQSKRFDLVIVAAVDLDASPTVGLFADLVDHIVIVARIDEQNAGTVEQFISRLGPDARKVRGAVFTGVATA